MDVMKHGMRVTDTAVHRAARTSRWRHYYAYAAILVCLMLVLLLDFDNLRQNQRQNRKLDLYLSLVTSPNRTVPVAAVLKQRTRRLPTAIIIGARKSGTRALLEALSLHPDVKTARFEVHFFDSDANYARGFDWYRSQMSPSRSHQMTIEKTPGYFTSSVAPERLYNYSAVAKLILIVRDPVVRTISDYSQVYYNKLAKGKQPQITFEQAVFADLNGDTGVRLNVDYKPVRNSLYAKHIRRWLRLFPIERILLLDGDRFAADPLSAVRTAERFLGLAPKVLDTQMQFNATKGFFCFQRLTGASKCLGDTKGRPHVNVTAATRDRLRTALAPFNERFFQLVGRRFEHW